MTPEARLIAITDAMAAALAMHGCHPSGSAIRSAWFAGVAANGPDGLQALLDGRKIDALEDEIQLLRLKIQEMHEEKSK